jgi:SPOR domain
MRNKLTVASLSVLGLTFFSFSFFKIEIHIGEGGPPAASAHESKNEETVASPLPKALAGRPEAPKQLPSAKPSGSFPDDKVGYYVIGYTTDNQEVALHESQRQNQKGFYTHVAYTSNWSGFTPGLYIVVYGIYDNKANAVGALTQVEAQGIQAYIKHSGNRLR